MWQMWVRHLAPITKRQKKSWQNPRQGKKVIVITFRKNKQTKPPPKILDYSLEGHDFKPQHCQVATAWPLNKAQLYKRYKCRSFYIRASAKCNKGKKCTCINLAKRRKCWQVKTHTSPTFTTWFCQSEESGLLWSGNYKGGGVDSEAKCAMPRKAIQLEATVADSKENPSSFVMKWCSLWV